MGSREGRYEYRAVRYRHAIGAMFRNGLDDSMTIMDIGAGMTEFDYCLRAEFNWRGRYIPIDGGIDGTDINVWKPARKVHWIVALELLEHLDEPYLKLGEWRSAATQGIVVSTPNPETTDVLGMDPTHVCEIHADDLRSIGGMAVREETFYGGVFSNGEPDSLFGVWTR
jgi:hypothetical protein